MSRTATALLNAIVFGREYIFWKIDNEAWPELKDNPLVLRVPNRRIVRQTLMMLVKRGYLTHEPHGNPLEEQFFATQKLRDHWIEIRRERQRPTP